MLTKKLDGALRLRNQLVYSRRGLADIVGDFLLLFQARQRKLHLLDVTKTKVLTIADEIGGQTKSLNKQAAFQQQAEIWPMNAVAWL